MTIQKHLLKTQTRQRNASSYMVVGPSECDVDSVSPESEKTENRDGDPQGRPLVSLSLNTDSDPDFEKVSEHVRDELLTSSRCFSFLWRMNVCLSRTSKLQYLQRYLYRLLFSALAIVAGVNFSTVQSFTCQ